jgi:uncharacterized protein (TIGR02594 family)
MTTALDQPWFALAKKDFGQRETLGPNDSPWIRAMLKQLRLEWLRNQPYCGTAMGKWFLGAGIQPPLNFFRARAWLEWGIPLEEPIPGCVVVFTRVGGGHVGLADSITRDGRIMVFGANQSNTVNVAPFDMKRVAGYRWPANWPIPNQKMPVRVTSAASSTNEA